MQPAGDAPVEADTHLARCDFQAFTHVGTKEQARQDVLKFSTPLANVLAEGDLQGVLVVYVASSSVWKQTVDLVSSSDEGLRASELTAEALADRAASLMQINAELIEMKQYCDETMRMVEAASPSLCFLNRVRIVTPLDFMEVLDYIKSRQRDNFKYWFQQTTYDVRTERSFFWFADVFAVVAVDYESRACTFPL